MRDRRVGGDHETHKTTKATETDIDGEADARRNPERYAVIYPRYLPIQMRNEQTDVRCLVLNGTDGATPEQWRKKRQTEDEKERRISKCANVGVLVTMEEGGGAGEWETDTEDGT